jgi:ParB family transcriptional regulator, chromosome partitioning protein
MAKIVEIREIPIRDLVIGEGQVRARRVNDGIDELAESIRIHGLLEPIVVCPYSKNNDLFEVLMGQRRFLAHQNLGRETILSAVIDQPVDKETAKALSLTENLIRRDLDSRDIIDACTALYRKYGSARAVAEETGIPYANVLKHLKYDRLHAVLRNKVDRGEVALEIALKAQDALAGARREPNPAEAIELAEALAAMTGAERRRLLQAKSREPDTPVKVLLRRYWAADEKPRQIVVTLPSRVHKSLQAYARKLGITQDVAAARLITASLEQEISAAALTNARH